LRLVGFLLLKGNKMKRILFVLSVVFLLSFPLSAGYSTANYQAEGGALWVVGDDSAGTLHIGKNGTLQFEGATDDGYELIFAITDITSSDKTVTFLNKTGMVAVYAADGTNGQVLSTNGSGTLSWIANAGTFAGGSITDNIVMANTKYIRSSLTTAEASAIQVYDLTATASYTNVLSWTNGDVPNIILGASTNTVAIASTGLNVSSAGAISGVTTLAMTDSLSLANGKSIKSSVTTGQSASILVYDNDTGPGFVNALSWTNGNAPAIVLGSANGTTTITTSDWGIDATGTVTGVASVAFDSGSKMYMDIVTVSNAEVKTLFSVPKVLVAAPGTHNVVQLVSCTLFYDYATAAFNTAANNLTIEYKADATGATASGTLSQTGFLDQTADMTATIIPVALAASVVTGTENQPLVLYCATADPTTGGGVMRVAISYRIIPSGF
jgi:hypothetical protein